MGLSGIQTVHGRAEDAARKAEHREKYDLSVSRAVSRLASLSEYCMPYVKEGGYFVSYKSGKAAEEVSEAKKAISVLGGRLEKEVDFKLYQTDMDQDQKNETDFGKVSEKSRNSNKRTNFIENEKVVDFIVE